MKKKTFNALMECWAGTPMEAVIEILKAGKFIEPSRLRVGTVGTVRGEMTLLEKALYTELCNLEAKRDEEISALMEESKDDSSDIDECIGCPGRFVGICSVSSEGFQEIIKSYEKNSDLIRNMMFTLMYDRHDIRDISLAQGFFILSSDEPTPEDSYELVPQKKTKNLQKALEQSIPGTLLEKVVEIIETGEFKDSERVIEEEDKLLIELNVFEKAMFTLNQELVQKVKKFEDDMDEISIRTESTRHHSFGGMGGFMGGLLDIDAFPFGPFPRPSGIIIMHSKGRKLKDNTEATNDDLKALFELHQKAESEFDSNEEIFDSMIAIHITDDAMEGYNAIKVVEGFKFAAYNEEC